MQGIPSLHQAKFAPVRLPLVLVLVVLLVVGERKTSPGSGESFPLGAQAWWPAGASSTFQHDRPEPCPELQSLFLPLRRNLELCCVVSLCCVSLLHHLIIFVRRRRGSLPPGGKAARSRVSLRLIRCFHSQDNPQTPLLAHIKSRSWQPGKSVWICRFLAASQL